MKHSLRLLIVILAILGSSTFSYAQEEDQSTPNREDYDKGNKGKNRHNQDIYLESEKEKTDYNYYERTKVHQPLMPSYALDTAAYQQGKKRKEQQRAFKDRQYYFPAKPKNQWEMGIHLGSMLISGDTRALASPFKSWGLGVSARKSFGYIFSMRAQYIYANSQGREWQPNWNLEKNVALNGTNDPNINYYTNPDLRPPNTSANITSEGAFFHNYKSKIHELSLQGVLTFGNISYHKERTLINFNATFGLGGMLYDTRYDALDANGNIYDFSGVLNTYYTEFSDADGGRDKGAVKSQLKDLLDGDFETKAERHGEDIGNYSFNPTFSVGGGMGFHLSKRITLSLETRLILTVDDLLDGNRWQVENREREVRGLTRDYDNLIYTSVGLHINLGKNSIEPLWWMNPMDYTYKQLGEMDPEKAINDLLQDDDEDGVPNRLDHEPETPLGAPVNPKGVALDSDSDGLIDHFDLEPFSPPGYPIDENGVAIIPEPETNMAAANIEEALNCDQVSLPSIHFDLDKYYIKPEFYAHLHQVAERMQLCPNIKVVAVGHTDNRASDTYNEQLSWNRVNEAIDYMVEKYGVVRERFLIDFRGEVDAETVSTEYGHYLNRRVFFELAGDGNSGSSDPAPPHPNLRAGSNKR